MIPEISWFAFQMTMTDKQVRGETKWEDKGAHGTPSTVLQYRAHSLALPPESDGLCATSYLALPLSIFSENQCQLFRLFLPLCKNKYSGSIYFLKILFIFRERGRVGERERNINVWLPLVRPLLGTWPTTQACALTGNQTCSPLVCSPLSHTFRAGSVFYIYNVKVCCINSQIYK